MCLCLVWFGAVWGDLHLLKYRFAKVHIFPKPSGPYLQVFVQGTSGLQQAKLPFRSKQLPYRRKTHADATVILRKLGRRINCAGMRMVGGRSLAVEGIVLSDIKALAIELLQSSGDFLQDLTATRNKPYQTQNPKSQILHDM